MSPDLAKGNDHCVTPAGGPHAGLSRRVQCNPNREALSGRKETMLPAAYLLALEAGGGRL